MTLDKEARQLTIHDYAYEDVKDTPIRAGAYLDLIFRGAVGSRVALGAAVVDGTGGAFTAKPKVVGQYWDPVKGKKFAKASFKAALSEPAPAATAVFELKKKVRLYDQKAFKAAYKAGTTCPDFLDGQPNQGMYFDLDVTHEEAGDPQTDRCAHLALMPPRITNTTGTPNLGAVVLVDGMFFGTKAPKFWLEYLVPNPKGGNKVKQLKLKAVKNFIFLDTKGKPSCMDVDNGTSQIQVQLPDAWPAGWDDVSTLHHLVLDNGVGLSAWRLIDP